MDATQAAGAPVPLAGPSPPRRAPRRARPRVLTTAQYLALTPAEVEERYPGLIARLGTEPDSRLAVAMGLSSSALRHIRCALGRPRAFEWRDREERAKSASPGQEADPIEPAPATAPNAPASPGASDRPPPRSSNLTSPPRSPTLTAPPRRSRAIPFVPRPRPPPRPAEEVEPPAPERRPRDGGLLDEVRRAFPGLIERLPTTTDWEIQQRYGLDAAGITMLRTLLGIPQVLPRPVRPSDT